MITEFNERSNELALVEGRLDFDSVMDLEPSGMAFLRRSDGPCQIDLSAVNYTDSAGAALLLAWSREAVILGRVLTFLNLPLEMRKLLRICSLDTLIPVES